MQQRSRQRQPEKRLQQLQLAHRRDAGNRWKPAAICSSPAAAGRCGFIAARPDWAEKIVDLKLATSFGSSPFGAELVHALLRHGTYRRHLDALRGRLADAMGETAHRLGKLGLRLWIEPRGGLFLWAELPDGLDAAEVSRHALGSGVVLAPGNVFSLSQSAPRFLRFNVAQCEPPRIFEVLKKAMAA